MHWARYEGSLSLPCALSKSGLFCDAPLKATQERLLWVPGCSSNVCTITKTKKVWRCAGWWIKTSTFYNNRADVQSACRKSACVSAAQCPVRVLSLKVRNPIVKDSCMWRKTGREGLGSAGGQPVSCLLFPDQTLQGSESYGAQPGLPWDLRDIEALWLSKWIFCCKFVLQANGTVCSHIKLTYKPPDGTYALVLIIFQLLAWYNFQASVVATSSDAAVMITLVM